MIGKILKGKSFKACIGYVLGKEGSKILDGNVIGSDPSELSRQFDWHCQINGSVKRAVYHLILSAPPEENLTDQQWRAIARDYLSALKLTDVPYLVVRHGDRPHEHLHIVTTRIKSDGTCVRDGWDHTRSRKIVRDIEEKYQLRSKPSVPRAPEGEKEKLDFIKRSLDELLTKYENLSLDEMSRLLAERDIQVSFKRTAKKKTIKNLFYEFDGAAFIDARLGEGYTLSGLEGKGVCGPAAPNQPRGGKGRLRDLTPDEAGFDALLKNGQDELKIGNFKLRKKSREFALYYRDRVLIRYIALAGQRALILEQHPHCERYLSSFKSSLNRGSHPIHPHQRSR